MAKKMAPVHPGEILTEEFLEPLEITPYRLATEIGVPKPRIYEITKKARAITADTAMRLGQYLGTSAEFWLNLQSHYDLEVERDRAAKEIAKIKPFRKQEPA